MAEEKPKILTLKGLEKMMGDLVGVVSALTEKVEKLVPKTQWVAKPEERSSVVKDMEAKMAPVLNDVPVPPKWRAMVDEILGTDFGLNVIYPDQGSGFMFQILVPKDKSNASKSYLEFYKVDVRTKALAGSEGIDGIKEFCEKVKTNLTRKQ